MTAPVVQWLPDGTPHSPQFGDIYRSRGVDGMGGLAQARHVFLHGCGLWPADAPTHWQGARQWHILENGFGLGLNFLATWDAWRQDPHAPATLCYTATEAYPPGADDIRRSAASFDSLQPLAAALAARWCGLLPGTHRWRWDETGPDGRPRQLLLTLLVGDATRTLSTLDVAVDSVFLDGFDPARNPAMWSPPLLQAVARLCRPGARLATWTVARAVRDTLAQLGFRVAKAPGLPPKRHCLQAEYAPSWAPKTARHLRTAAVAAPASALVIGAGLAGSAAAYSLATRGWRVTVLDAAGQAAAGASGLPVGLVAPHVSPDDAPLSRLTRAGLACTRARAEALLRRGIDWGDSGVLEHRVEGKRALPETTAWAEHGQAWSVHASAERCAAAGLPPQAQALWHPKACWLRPARLVAAQLAHPAIRWQGAQPVAALRRDPSTGRWTALGADGAALAQAQIAVVCAGYDTLALVQASTGLQLPLHALRGQVAWGAMDALPAPQRSSLPRWPVNGHGALIAGVPGNDDGATIWCFGATFVRGSTARDIDAQEHAANFAKLQRLLPQAAQALADQWPHAQAWAAVRCTVPDRFPLVGAIDPEGLPGLHLITGLGARGLTLSVLCGEVLAAALHAEPWPLERSLALALQAARYANVPAPVSGPSIRRAA